jgi:hypothetical protein
VFVLKYIKTFKPKTAVGGKAAFRKEQQSTNAHFSISARFCGISSENMLVQRINILSGITVMRGGTLKLVKMQPPNASSPMLSIPSWRRIGHLREK